MLEVVYREKFKFKLGCRKKGKWLVVLTRVGEALEEVIMVAVAAGGMRLDGGLE